MCIARVCLLKLVKLIERWNPKHLEQQRHIIKNNKRATRRGGWGINWRKQECI